MMSRKFTTREKVLLLVCAVLFLSIFYYEVVWKGTSDTIAKYDTADIEQVLMASQLRAKRLNTMKEVIEENQGKTTGNVAPYNNLNNEISELNTILAGASTYNLSFADATTDGSVVRRDVNISYHASDYQTAKRIMQLLNDCQYKCKIRDVDISTTAASATASSGIQNSGDIDVSLRVTFYETVTDAATVDGLAEYKDSSSGK